MPRKAPPRRAARPPRFGVAYLGGRVEDIDEIAKAADWVLLPMNEADTVSGAARVRRLAARARERGHYWTGEWIGDPTVYASIDRWHRTKFGRPMPREKTDEVARFQLEILRDLLVDLTREARKRGLKVYADFTPRPEHEVLWRALAGEVDGLGVSAYRLGARELAVWSYRGSADFAGLASEDPDAAWRATTEAFDAVRAAARRDRKKRKKARR